MGGKLFDPWILKSTPLPSIHLSSGESVEVWDGKSQGPPRKLKFPDKEEVGIATDWHWLALWNSGSSLFCPGADLHPDRALQAPVIV